MAGGKAVREAVAEELAVRVPAAARTSARGVMAAMIAGARG